MEHAIRVAECPADGQCCDDTMKNADLKQAEPSCHKMEMGPLSLQELVMHLTEELGNGKEKVVPRIQALMNAYDGNAAEWKRYEFFDERLPYTRNLIATDNETFTLMLLCWNPHKASLPHAHAGSECFMRVVAGELREFCFAFPEPHQPLKCTSERTIRSGDIAYINDSFGIHKIENQSDKGACTLHLYLPPYDHCRCFPDEQDGEGEMRHITYYSELGSINE